MTTERWVVCVPEGVVSKPKAEIRRFLAGLAERKDVLLLARDARALDDYCRPGVGTLHSPLFPSRYAEAVTRATGVLAFDVPAALFAASRGVPAVLVPADERAASWAKRLGISVATALSPKVFDEVRLPEAGKTSRHRASVRKLLSEGGWIFPEVAGRETGPLEICAITDKEYLAFLLGLIANVETLHDGARWHVLALDGESIRALRSLRRPDISLYSLSDLWAGQALTTIRGRPIAHQAFSSKPALLLKVLKKTKGPIFFSDTDVFYFRSPGRLPTELGAGSALLFPQWNDSLPHARLHGLFNTGMLAVGGDSTAFLQWWKDLCLLKCSPDANEGYFVDQGFLDLAPLYFENLVVYRDGDENIGKWNCTTLGIRLEKEVALTSGNPIGSFHAAIPDDEGIFEAKATWDQLTWFFSQGLAGPRELRAQVFLQQARHWSSLRFLKALEFLLGNRMGVPLPSLDDQLAGRILSALPGQALAAGPLVYDALRSLKRRWMPTRLGETLPEAKWPEMQRALIDKWNGAET